MQRNQSSDEEGRECSQGSLRVLIADDSPVVVVTLRRLLDEREDVDIVGVAENGVQAVELGTSLAPDLVLMDLRMPLMNGLEATRQLKESEAPPVIIMVTADEGVAEMAVGKASGPDAVCSKYSVLEDLPPAIDEFFPRG